MYGEAVYVRGTDVGWLAPGLARAASGRTAVGGELYD
jgi:hypothetical protein